MLVKSCRKLKAGSLCSCFSSQKPPSGLKRLQIQGFLQCPLHPTAGHTSVVEMSVCLGCLPSASCLFLFHLSSLAGSIWAPLPCHIPPSLFSIFIAAVSLLFFDFGHPQREDGNSRRKGSRGWARLPRARLPQAPMNSCVQALWGVARPGPATP